MWRYAVLLQSIEESRARYGYRRARASTVEPLAHSVARADSIASNSQLLIECAAIMDILDSLEDILNLVEIGE